MGEILAVPMLSPWPFFISTVTVRLAAAQIMKIDASTPAINNANSCRLIFQLLLSHKQFYFVETISFASWPPSSLIVIAKRANVSLQLCARAGKVLAAKPRCSLHVSELAKSLANALPISSYPFSCLFGRRELPVCASSLILFWAAANPLPRVAPLINQWQLPA